MVAFVTGINAEAVYTVGQAATAAGVHADTIRRWTNAPAGTPRFLRSTRTLGQDRRIRGSDLIEALERTVDAGGTGGTALTGDPTSDVQAIAAASDSWRSWRPEQVRTATLEDLLREIPLLSRRLDDLREASLRALDTRSG
jgi:hypothetical protein